MDKPLKIYPSVIDFGALEQMHSAMEQDFAVSGALMPDAHLGYSLPIGAVVATKDVVVPAWVGYDIGCGMCAVPLVGDVTKIPEKVDGIFDSIYKHVPVGQRKHESTQLFPELPPHSDVVTRAMDQRDANRQLGTLGGGNHFIEIGKGHTGWWIIIHSGSRGTGHAVASNYMALAAGSDKPKEGHFGFKRGSEEFAMYMMDVEWAQQYALANRLRIADHVIAALNEHVNVEGNYHALINRNHNHVQQRGDLLIHRKGATHAEKGMQGVIPGNMRDGSFLVEGLGNPDSLWSSSHGAGRVLGRKQAQRELDLTEFEETMHGVKAKVDESTLDESPRAYKNIFTVMEEQQDLVVVWDHVRPVLNIKA